MFITKLNFRLRPRPHYAGGNWKRCFHSENSSNVFRPQKKQNKTKKRNNRRTFWICFVENSHSEIT